MYGPVRSLQETMTTLRLVPSRKVISESDDPEKEKVEKKRIIEEARQQRTKTAAPAPKDDKSAAKSKLMILAEDVENLSKEYAAIASSKPTPKEMDGVVASLNHVTGFSADAVKKYEWRSDDKSKKYASLFTMIKEEAEKLLAKVKKGDITEEDDARKEVNPLLKRFVEAVGVVKGDFKINEEVFNALKESLKNVK